MRKCLLLLAALLLYIVPSFSQNKPLTPYEYGHRWYFAFQGGPLFFSSDYAGNLFKERRARELFSGGMGLALGYNITNEHEIRFMGNYSRKTGVCEPFDLEDIDPAAPAIPTFTYKFRSLNLFVDYILNYNALAENFVPFTGKIYTGIGASYTFDFTDPGHPEVWLTDPNLVPGFHFGIIAEYDFKDGFGLYTDMGAAFYFERYNGQPPVGFPMDFEALIQFGLIYHFPLKTNRR